jgi:hypothetical protein
MRKSILALSVGGLFAVAATFVPGPAAANHIWSPQYGWRTGHYHRPAYFVAPQPAPVVIRRTPRRTVVLNADGSRTIYRHYPRREQVVVVPRY